MKHVIAALLFFTLVCTSYAQYDPAKVKKALMQQYEAALQKAIEHHFEEAILDLTACVTKDPNFMDARLSLAGIYGEKRNYASAIQSYAIARAIDSTYFKEYELPYSINLAGNGQFKEALHAIDRFLTLPNLNNSSIKAAQYRKRCYEFALNFNPKEPLHFTPTNLGSSINSDVSEYYPSITIDGKTLVFTKRIQNRQEDFFSSTQDSTGKWTQSAALPGLINTTSNEGAPAISQDGNWLVFTACNREDGWGSCDLYISYLNKDGWSPAENLGAPINSEAWESAPSLSPDKRDLYFSSNRPGGLGGLDIYVSRLQQDGHYGTPENLGPSINTPGDEATPFIHADNQTLYFTSNGHPGFGGDDLFLSQKQLNDAWSTPINLGYPINSIENEGSLFIAANGKDAYYASDRGEGLGGLDLYTFVLPESVRPIKTTWIKGIVYDRKTLKGLPATIDLIDLSNNKLLNKIQTDPSGNYLITLPLGKDFAFHVNRKNYLFYSEHISLYNTNTDIASVIDIPLQPIEAGASIILKNIFFKSNEYALLPTSLPELEKITALLKENPKMRIEISGHTDHQGADAYNLKLSMARANAVATFIVQQGISVNRIEMKGYGATKPINNNETEEGRAQNRRTEMRIIQ